MKCFEASGGPGRFGACWGLFWASWEYFSGILGPLGDLWGPAGGLLGDCRRLTLAWDSNSGGLLSMLAVPMLHRWRAFLRCSTTSGSIGFALGRAKVSPRSRFTSTRNDWRWGRTTFPVLVRGQVAVERSAVLGRAGGVLSSAADAGAARCASRVRSYSDLRRCARATRAVRRVVVGQVGGHAWRVVRWGFVPCGRS